MMLAVQSNIPQVLSVWVIDEKTGRAVERKMAVSHHGSEHLLRLVVNTLRNAKTPPTEITQALIVRGPGAFTAIRTGLVVVNTLAEVFHWPVKGIVTQQPLSAKIILAVYRQGRFTRQAVKPWYGRQPNITRPSKRVRSSGKMKKR